MKIPPRYADIWAEAGIKKLQFNNNYDKLTNPPSILRFQFMWEGAVVGRHVNHFIREEIYKEHIIRLKTKDTQGLLWRFKEETSFEWSDIKKHKGRLGVLTRLRRSHTGSIYESEVYREGCHNERMSFESTTNDVCQEVNKGLIKTKDIIQNCSRCMWCIHHEKISIPKGNRLHAMLHCSHQDLSSFRNRMSNTIEQKLKVLFLQLRSYTNDQFIIKTLENIAKIRFGPKRFRIFT